MLSSEAAFFSILFCLSTLSVVISFDHESQVIDLSSASNKAQLLDNPYYPSAPGLATYQDFYEMPSQYEPIWKRAPAAGFYGMRGKKAPSTNFYGMRGKKGPAGFMGMRGKKNMDTKILDGTLPSEFSLGRAVWTSKESLGPSDEEKVLGEQHEIENFEKRVPGQGFMGLRGKRSLKTLDNGFIIDNLNILH